MNKKLLEELVDDFNKGLIYTTEEKNVAKSYLHKNIKPTDIVVTSAKGSTLTLDGGLSLIDFSSQTVNCILGQNDTWVSYNLAAHILSDQPSFLTSKLHSQYHLNYIDKLIKALKLKNKIINYKQTNGTDVTELAIKSAFDKSEYDTLMSFKGSYHGQSLVNYHSSHLQQDHLFWEYKNSTIFMDAPPDENDEDVKNKEDVLIKKIEAKINKCFAVIIEPIQVNNIINTPSVRFFRMLDSICKKNAVPLIFDEVQTGFGWLGTLTAAELYGVNPEFIALSKAITAGYGPLAILIADKGFDNLAYGTGEKTNGADIRSLIASSAVIDRLCGLNKDRMPIDLDESLKLEIELGLLKKIHPKKTRLLSSLLIKALDDFPDILSTLKGKGLIRGIVFKDQQSVSAVEVAKKVYDECLDEGLLLRCSGPALIFKPPLTTTKKEFEDGFLIFRKVLRRLYDEK